MKTIPLTKGFFAIVDDEDYEVLSRFKWHAQVSTHRSRTKVYAKRNETYYSEDGKRRQASVYMHKVICPPGDGHETDHINGDGLDNRKANLRPASKTQNRRNRASALNSTSRFVGVSIEAGGRVRATICAGGRTKHLGRFSDERSAAQAYDLAARERYGVFAHTNFGE